MKTILLITLLFVSINSRTVYMCHDDPFKDEQCMKKETLGSVDFVWVRKCKGAKVCVNLPYYNGIIGACSIKVRSHYDGEACANGNKCTSGICGGTKCKGLNPDVKCQVGLGQCKKGYLCMQRKDGDGNIVQDDYRCQKPIDKNKDCSGYLSLPSPSIRMFEYGSSVFDPSLNPCKLGYVCTTITPDSGSATTTCVEIGSLSEGTKVNNPLACKTGFGTFEIPTNPNDEIDTSTFKCAKAENDATNTGYSLTTSRGGVFTQYANITTAFDKWRDEWKKKSLKDEDAIYEAYRYTKNKKKINEAFFKYTCAAFVQDADECAYDYIWKQSSSNSLKFSLMILILALLF